MPDNPGEPEKEQPTGTPGGKTDKNAPGARAAGSDANPSKPDQSVDRLIRAADRLSRQVSQLQSSLGDFGDSIKTEGSQMDDQLRESLEKVQAHLQLTTEHVENTLLPALSGSAWRLAEMLEFRRLLGVDLPQKSNPSEPS